MYTNKFFSGLQGVRLWKHLVWYAVSSEQLWTATNYAQQGNLNRFNRTMQTDILDAMKVLEDRYGTHSKGGVAGYLLTPEKRMDFYKSLKRIQNAKLDLVEAESRNLYIEKNYKNWQKAMTGLDDAIQQGPVKIAALDASIDSSSTTRGAGIRTIALAASISGLYFSAQNVDDLKYLPESTRNLRKAEIMVNGINVGQHVGVNIAYFLRKKAFFAFGAKSPQFRFMNQAVRSLSLLSDDVFHMYNALGAVYITNDIKNQDWASLAIDTAATGSGIIYFLGKNPTANIKNIKKAGRGLVIALLLMGATKAIYDYEMAPHRFENKDAKKYYEDVLGFKNGSQLMRCNGNGLGGSGVGAGKMIHADALMHGYDLDDPQQMAACKEYINSLTEKELKIYIDGLFKWEDASRAHRPSGEYPKTEDIAAV
jgi:hypothetical protein